MVQKQTVLPPMTNKIKISVPASSGNIGTGFDTLGLAVNLINQFELSLNDSETALGTVQGIDKALEQPCLQMSKAASDYFFSNAGIPTRHYTLSVENHIPIARGLASSATFRLAILEGLNQLLGANVSQENIVKWASELEGCTDNAASCYYGGMAASGIVNNRLVVYRCDISPEVDFVAVSPEAAVETAKARVIFPPTLPRHHAIDNLNRGILLAMAFARNDYENMAGLFDDRLHQPCRQANIPALEPLYDVIEAATNAGAIGAFLSGSGSTMMAMTLRNREAIAEAMTTALGRYGMAATVRHLKADNQGLQWTKE